MLDSILDAIGDRSYPEVVSSLSLLVAAVGVTLTYKRASLALNESRKATQVALWSDAQEAVQRLIGFNPAGKPIDEKLNDLRIAMIALVDGLDDWPRFDEWLELERMLGAGLGREVMDRSQPGQGIEQTLQILDPFMRWATHLSQNLRQFRRVGYDGVEIANLCTHQTKNVVALYESHQWEQPGALARVMDSQMTRSSSSTPLGTRLRRLATRRAPR